MAVNLMNRRIYIRIDLINLLRSKYPKETKHMTDDTMVNWVLSDHVLISN